MLDHPDWGVSKKVHRCQKFIQFSFIWSFLMVLSVVCFISKTEDTIMLDALLTWTNMMLMLFDFGYWTKKEQSCIEVSIWFCFLYTSSRYSLVVGHKMYGIVFYTCIWNIKKYILLQMYFQLWKNCVGSFNRKWGNSGGVSKGPSVQCLQKWTMGVIQTFTLNKR